MFIRVTHTCNIALLANGKFHSCEENSKKGRYLLFLAFELSAYPLAKYGAILAIFPLPRSRQDVQ